MALQKFPRGKKEVSANPSKKALKNKSKSADDLTLFGGKAKKPATKAKSKPQKKSKSEDRGKDRLNGHYFELPKSKGPL